MAKHSLHHIRRWAFALFLLVAQYGTSAAEDAVRWITGVVRSQSTSQPISNAWVRIASPAIDLRSVRDRRNHVFDGHTDQTGRHQRTEEDLQPR